MYIIWRKRWIETERQVPLLHTGEPDDWLEDTRPAWQLEPLHCLHAGMERFSMTPVLVRAYRQDGKPRQQYLAYLPSFRSCCLDNHIIVCAWWEITGEQLEEAITLHGSDMMYTEQCRQHIMQQLGEAIPPPTRGQQASFRKYCQRQSKIWEKVRVSKQAGGKREEEEVLAQQQRQMEAERQAYSARQEALREIERQQQEEARAQRQHTEYLADLMLLRSSRSADEVKTIFRRLAFKYHPDRFGKHEHFVGVSKVYEETCARFKKR